MSEENNEEKFENQENSHETKKEIKEIVNIKFKELVEKLQNIQTRVATKSLRNGKLEKLTEEARKSFEDLVESFREKRNLLKEMIRRKADLRKWKINIFKSLFPINYKMLLSMPFIYGLIIPLVFFHICLEIYHQLCFRLYGIPRVRTREYFVFDRQMLPYLNWFEKFNCLYCSYASSLTQYIMEIIGRTERFWCPIKHAKKTKNSHSQYPKFMGYLDAQAYREEKSELRDFSDIIEEEKTECDFSKKD